MVMAGCASYEFGKDFDVTNVSKIEKGKTTEAELVEMFGEPFIKSVISKSDVKWYYSFHSGVVNSFGGKVTSEKSIDLILTDGIVVNYAVKIEEPLSPALKDGADAANLILHGAALRAILN